MHASRTNAEEKLPGPGYQLASTVIFIKTHGS